MSALAPGAVYIGVISEFTMAVLVLAYSLVSGLVSLPLNRNTSGFCYTSLLLCGTERLHRAERGAFTISLRVVIASCTVDDSVQMKLQG